MLLVNLEWEPFFGPGFLETTFVSLLILIFDRRLALSSSSNIACPTQLFSKSDSSITTALFFLFFSSFFFSSASFCFFFSIMLSTFSLFTINSKVTLCVPSGRVRVIFLRITLAFFFGMVPIPKPVF